MSSEAWLGRVWSLLVFFVPATLLPEAPIFLGRTAFVRGKAKIWQWKLHLLQRAACTLHCKKTKPPDPHPVVQVTIDTRPQQQIKPSLPSLPFSIAGQLPKSFPRSLSISS